MAENVALAGARGQRVRATAALPDHPQRAAVLLSADDHDTQQGPIAVLSGAELLLSHRGAVDAGGSLDVGQLALATHAGDRRSGRGAARSAIPRAAPEEVATAVRHRADVYRT